MLIRRSKIKFARTFVVIATGVAIAALLATSSFPRDVVENLHDNLALAAASALVSALGFGVAALFIGVGFRTLRQHARTLELADDDLVVSSWGKERSRHSLSDVERLVIIPGRADPQIWILEFDDGEAFGADRECSNFRPALEHLDSQMGQQTTEMSLAEYDPSRGIPAWLAKALGRGGGGE